MLATFWKLDSAFFDNGCNYVQASDQIPIALFPRITTSCEHRPSNAWYTIN
jgi:hypothetical protein